jgi:hypothetical protein
VVSDDVPGIVNDAWNRMHDASNIVDDERRRMHDGLSIVEDGWDMSDAGQSIVHGGLRCVAVYESRVVVPHHFVHGVKRFKDESLGKENLFSGRVEKFFGVGGFDFGNLDAQQRGGGGSSEPAGGKLVGDERMKISGFKARANQLRVDEIKIGGDGDEVHNLKSSRWNFTTPK